MAGALSEAFGITTISAAGASARQGASGAIAGFRGLFRALKTGKSVFLAAEVPPVPGRNIAPGIVPLARKTGRPIIPVAAASTRRSIMERIWDKNQVHHPFSKFAVVGAPVLWVTDEMTDRRGRGDALSAIWTPLMRRRWRRRTGCGGSPARSARSGQPPPHPSPQGEEDIVAPLRPE